MSAQVYRRSQRPRSPSRTRSFSRNRTTSVYEEKTPTPPPEGCICQRPYGTVFCKSCGWLYRQGRVRTPCPIHARTLYLLDIDQCPKCRAYPPILAEMQ